MSKKYKPIPLATEDMPDDRVEESCAFCRERTIFWTDILQRSEEQQVPCCTICAETFRQKDVPSKQYWLVVVSLVMRESAMAFRAGRRSAQTQEGGKVPRAHGNNAATQ